MPPLVVLEARGLWFRYSRGQGYVLRGASLRVGAGEVAAVVGPMGSGKTTLLLVLAGLLPPERGEVLLDGAPLGGGPESRRRVGILFQSPDDQLFNPTVYDEIAYALRSMGLPEDVVRERVERVAGELGIRGLLGRRPYRLSYGQKRLVALASVLVYDPDVLLLDEPTANLDARAAAVLEEAIRGAAAAGKVVVIATHDLDLVLGLSTKTCLLDGGRLDCAPTRELLRRGLHRLPLRLPLALRALLHLCRGDADCVENAINQAKTRPP